MKRSEDTKLLGGERHEVLGGSSTDVDPAGRKKLMYRSALPP